MRDVYYGEGVIILFALLAVLAGCSGEERPPDNLLPEDPYIDLLVELQLLESYRYSRPGDSLTVSIDSVKQTILEKYGITEEEFMVSHEYYRNQLEQQGERITRAIDRMLLEDSRVRDIRDTTANRD